MPPTADFCTAGESERILGGLIRRAGNRERLVLTGKFTNSIDPSDPNAGGNGRKHIIRAVGASLKRLGTDYLDLYLLHTWDRITPVEESCGPWTTWSGRARSGTAASLTYRPGTPPGPRATPSRTR